MLKKQILCAAIFVGVCLQPVAVMAQAAPAPQPATASAAAPPQPAATSKSSDQFSLGTQWVGGSNTGLYGRYNGFTQQGMDVLGDFSVQRRDAWDSGKTWYYDFTGTNLNFQTGDQLAKNFHDNTYTNNTSNDLGPMAELSLKLGDQGSWGVAADYDAISYTGNIINSIYTVNGTTATLNNNFPAWGGATPSPAGGTPGLIHSYTTMTLAPAEVPFQVGTRRDILTFSGQTFLDDWTLSANIRHEHKEGSVEQSLFAYSNSQEFGGVAFTMPIDYDTDRLDVTAAYNLPDLQAVLQYTYAHFSDNNSGVTVPAFLSATALSPVSGPFAQTALYSTPPSTSAHYVTAMFGDSLMPGTRITLNLRGGVELQNSTFPANNADPYLSNTLGKPAFAWFSNLNSFNQGTSATSPEDVAWVYQGNLAIASKLATDLDGRASYSFDGRSVHLNQYEVWTGGAVFAEATATTPAYVVPQDWFKQTAKVELGYRILPESNTKLTVDYAFADDNRTNAQVAHSITNTETARLSSMVGSDILGSLSYEHGDRTGSLVYGTAWNNLTTGFPGPFNTPSGAYYEAPMVSNAVVFRVDYAAKGELTGGLFLKYTNENYHYAGVPDTAALCAAAPGCAAGDWTLTGVGTGIKQDYNVAVGPDVNYRPDTDVNLHFYYTYEKIYYDNLGNGACAESNTGVCAGSAGYYQNTYASNMNSAGLSGTWQVNSKVKVAAEYNMSSGAINFGEFNGVQVANVTGTYQNVTPYPDINSVMHQLKLSAVYRLAANIECSLQYQFSMFRNNDWDDLAEPIIPTTNTGTAISSLNAGYAAPHYNVSTIGTVLKVTL